ncbi:MAG: hypothetical protein IAF38_14520 [Bacteroidia bacterium]|nr:hypothetical protein [Bacteroidia bacterium]
MKIFRNTFLLFLCAVTGLLFFSCSSDVVVEEKPNFDSLKKKSSVSEGPDRTYQYKPQLFKIDLLEFKLNKDDLPFPFNEKYLKEKRIKTISMTMKMKEGSYNTTGDFVWEINPDGQIVKESKMNGRRIENSVEKNYVKGLLDEVNILNPGDKFQSAIKKVKYQYANNKLMTVYDILENSDTVETNYRYDNARIIEKIISEKKGITGSSYYSYFEGRLSKVEFYNGDTIQDSRKGGIHTYTYTRKGKLLYGDHWYPGISNDSYIFEFDEEDRLKEITYKIFLKKEELKIPGKTKSYRFEYENRELKRINYFMQAKDFSQSGTFEFKYEYY